MATPKGRGRYKAKVKAVSKKKAPVRTKKKKQINKMVKKLTKGM